MHLFLDTNLLVYEEEVIEFYTNLVVLEVNMAILKVFGVELFFDKVYLGKILQILSFDLENYIWDKDEDCMFTSTSLRGGSPIYYARF